MPNCKNDDCEYSECCRLRIGYLPGGPERQRTSAPASTDTAPPQSDSIRFLLRCEPQGWVGMLTVTGTLYDSDKTALDEVEGQLHTMSGLFVSFESNGGDFNIGERLERLLLVARQKMPVISYVRQAQSTCVLPSLVSDRVYGDQNAICGGVGMIFFTCDGSTPTMVINSQSPRKHEGRPPTWPPRNFADEAKRLRLQEIADRQYEKDIELAAGYCCQPVDALRPYLDGRPLTAGESLKCGLLNRICSEDAAYAALLKMADSWPKS